MLLIGPTQENGHRPQVFQTELTTEVRRAENTRRLPVSDGPGCRRAGIVSQASQSAKTGSGDQMGLVIERFVDLTVAGEETLS